MKILVREVDSEEDPELDDILSELWIAEFQEIKSRRFLASRLDKYNPVAFSKRSSTFTFKSRRKNYKVTVKVDSFSTGEKSASQSLMNALKSPPFVITTILCSATICLLALLTLYSSSSVAEIFSEKDLYMMNRHYILMLDHCQGFYTTDDNRPDPRIFGAAYSICNKAINQLQLFCNEHYIAACDDQRLGLYINGTKPRA